MIRKATINDSKAVADLLSQLGIEIEEKTGAKINTDKELIQKLFINNIDKKFYTYLYEIDKEIVGFITYINSFSLYAKGDFITITELYIKEEFRSKGIGEKLLDTIILLAKQENKIRIELTTPPLPEFQKSLEFYIKNGFSVTGGAKVKYELS